MDTETLRTLGLVSRYGSLAATARILGVDPSSVSRLVAGAEAELGVRLFQRSTRRLTVTEAGKRFLQSAMALVEEFDLAVEEAARDQSLPSGVLRVTASVAFAQECIVPHLGPFHASFPDITLALLSSDSNLDLLSDEIDLAIRLAAAPEGELISTRLMHTKYLVCASPDYRDRTIPLDDPSGLSTRACLRLALPQYRDRWLFRGPDGSTSEVPISGHFLFSNALALRQAARDGLGPALLADWLVARDVAAGRLLDLFPRHRVTATTFETGAWALYPSRRFLPRKVRVFIDFLRQTL